MSVALLHLLNLYSDPLQVASVKMFENFFSCAGHTLLFVYKNKCQNTREIILEHSFKNIRNLTICYHKLPFISALKTFLEIIADSSRLYALDVMSQPVAA